MDHRVDSRIRLRQRFYEGLLEDDPADSLHEEYEQVVCPVESDCFQL